MEKLKTFRFIVRLIIAVASALLGVIGSSEDKEEK